ncbi:MAG: RNA polymerase sporulation sigma factor SigK [Oscillospiraceae bacterium]|nr:RNA polymerase sporulation sigma factor SigK [Oscillospiraceae bacterium]
MLSGSIFMLLHGIFFMLRVSGGGTFPKPLTADEERDCLLRMANGDTQARNTLIERNLRLVAHIIKKYYTQTSDQDDLISIGTIGLIKGISTFKPDKNVRLATYASRCIENEILMYFRSWKKLANEVSLSDSIENDKDGNSLSLMDIICVEDTLLEDLSSQDDCKNVYALVQHLEPREREIISLRYGLSGRVPLTQREVADHCGISRSYVSRIEKKALEKLRGKMEGK